MKATNINEVVDLLELIIIDSKNENDPLGYFAALYQTVTMKVREDIGKGVFQDDKRMERLDVTFANRYLEAYSDYKTGKTVTASWLRSFQLSKKYRPIVLQHLLMGMNAHINLDLGIAVAEITAPQNIDDLQADFNKLNDILAKLVEGVEQDLSKIWPRLIWILKATKRIDDFLINFSMKVARDGAWSFAKELVGKTPAEKNELILRKDVEVANFSRIISHPGLIINIILGIVRLGERGTVADKIKALES
ncbi:MAG: DUF5995 family protein [Bacteroidota bacterium]